MVKSPPIREVQEKDNLAQVKMSKGNFTEFIQRNYDKYLMKQLIQLRDYRETQKDFRERSGMQLPEISTSVETPVSKER